MQTLAQKQIARQAEGFSVNWELRIKDDIPKCWTVTSFGWEEKKVSHIDSSIF